MFIESFNNTINDIRSTSTVNVRKKLDYNSNQTMSSDLYLRDMKLSVNKPKETSEDIFTEGLNGKKNSNSNDPEGWSDFLAKIKQIKKSDLLPKPEDINNTEVLSDSQSKPLKEAVILVPDKMEDGTKLAVDDLRKYLESVTGKPVKTVSYKEGEKPVFPEGSENASIIAVGNGQALNGIIPDKTGQASGYNIKANEIEINGKSVSVVGINGDDKNGQQYGIYRFMQLSGKKFLNYMDEYTPPVGKALIPANGFAEVHNPTNQMQTRGFAPHTYHPIPLSIALHEPSDEHLEMMKKYIDWNIQNGQNYIMFPMLELDKINKYIPIKNGDDNFKKWIPYANEIVNYAHERGVQISIKLAFANYVSANTYAINPVEALWQSFKLDGENKDVKKVTSKINAKTEEIAKLEKDLQTAEPKNKEKILHKIEDNKKDIIDLNKKLAQENKEYKQLLSKYSEKDKGKIHKTIDDFMQVKWDEITWNLGTSEFSPTNDDLTIQWMNDAADYIDKKYPGTSTGSRSHIPGRPYSEKYDESYFNLIRFSDSKMANYVHTTHLYSLTDPAPVYGNQNFEDKLKYLYRSTPERKDVYYPETSYWVAYDVSVPLFLPVYMLNRKHDLEIVKNVKNLDGHVGFTTAWEWGYWLTDYAVAKMQMYPDKSLTEIIDGAFSIFDKAGKPMTNIMIDAMQEQQKYLIDKNMMRHVQGFSALTDFGASIKDIPVLNKFIEGSNSTPIRLKPSSIMKWDNKQIEEFQKGELKDLKEMRDSFEKIYTNAKALESQIPEASKRYYDEILDGYKVNYLRSNESYLLLQSTVLARRSELENNPELKVEGKKLLDESHKVVDQAMSTISKREESYRDKPEYTYAEKEAPTIWNNRYLTPVHTGEYWKRSVKEVDKIYEEKNFLNDLNKWLFKHSASTSSTVG